MKIPLFRYIDEAIALKHTLRFEIEEANQAIDAFFSSAFATWECFVHYTSRVKTDDSLKEKIIRQNLSQEVSSEGIFAHISDLIGCRLECRFLRDEEAIYRGLFNLFPTKRSGGYYRCETDPRIELRLDDPQPKDQKNGYRSYRIDGRFLGEHVLNFELQIKSIVNVFWNEIDHKILYKNYNYVLTEKFVYDMMDSIMGDLKIIDRQMEMIYDHLRSLDRPNHSAPRKHIKQIIGRLIQDAYLTPLRERKGITFDFRSSIDLITDFLFARVEYETREKYATEFLRIMDDAFSGQKVTEQFGERIEFDPPVYYHDPDSRDFGLCLEQVVNEDILWNLLIQILIDLNSHMSPADVFRTFVDYLFFSTIHTIRGAFTDEGESVADYAPLIDEMTQIVLRGHVRSLKPVHFTEVGLSALRRNTRTTLRSELPEHPDAVLEHFRAFYPAGGKQIIREKGMIVRQNFPTGKNGGDYADSFSSCYGSDGE